MEQNKSLREMWQDRFDKEDNSGPTPEQLARIMLVLQPVLKRNRRKRHTRQALRSAGVLCSIGFFLWSANIFDSPPTATRTATVETVRSVPVVTNRIIAPEVKAALKSTATERIVKMKAPTKSVVKDPETLTAAVQSNSFIGVQAEGDLPADQSIYANKGGSEPLNLDVPNAEISVEMNRIAGN